jgi:hypothetical protein
MCRPRHLLVNRHCSQIEGFGLSIAALVVIKPSEIVEADSYIRMLPP